MNTVTDVQNLELGEMPAPLVFTDNAAKKVKELIEKKALLTLNCAYL
jgi:iron-sulfur cluster insertion protein